MMHHKVAERRSNRDRVMEVKGRPQAEGEWSTGFCDTCSDCSSCCMTCWCPCVTFGRIAEIVDKGSTSCCGAGALYMLLTWFTGCGFIYSCHYRTKMRKQYNLKGSECGDCFKHCFCERCALTQAYRELTNRGFDVALGWQGNAGRQNGGVAMGAPVVQGGMMR